LDTARIRLRGVHGAPQDLSPSSGMGVEVPHASLLPVSEEVVYGMQTLRGTDDVYIN